MLVPCALQQPRVQDKVTWCKLSIYSFGLSKNSRIRFFATNYKPFHVTLSLVSSQSEDTYFHLIHTNATASILQVNVENGTSNLQIWESIAVKDRKNNGKKEVIVDTGSYVEAESRIEGLHDEENRRRAGGYGNKGKVPWNKGGKHSEETKQRIRERTKMAMANPKVREILRAKAEGCTQSSETKLKIRTAIMDIWDKRKRQRQRQEICVREWAESIAESARKGSGDDVEHEWDSYNLILTEMRAARKRHQQQMKKDPSSSKSYDHRLKISEAIRAKWADPDYRNRVQDGFCSYLSKHGGRAVRKSRKVSDKENDENIGEFQATVVIKNAPPAYKDPLLMIKLAKLKQMQATRHSMKQNDLTERARVLMDEAKKAATALEAVAAPDTIVLYSLLESRRLLAEADRSIKTALKMRNCLLK